MNTNPNPRHFYIGFAELLNVEELWNQLTYYLGVSGCLPQAWRVSQIAGHPEHMHTEEDLILSSQGVTQLIAERGMTGFRVDSARARREYAVQYALCYRKGFGSQASLECRIGDKAKVPQDWGGLIETLLSSHSGIGGWQWNGIYTTWQNTGNPSVYERRFGIIPPGTRRYLIKALDTMSSDREMLNSDHNPGRALEIMPRIWFYPTAEMWLGPHFWQYAACTKEEALAADFWLEAEDKGSFVYLKSWHEPFWRPDGEQGRQQQKIWRLLFNEDCEWPPGSGGISDEPMYGPPELMPENR